MAKRRSEFAYSRPKCPNADVSRQEEPVQEASEEVQAEVVVDEAPVAQEKQEAEEANEQEASEEEEPDQPFTFEVLSAGIRCNKLLLCSALLSAVFSSERGWFWLVPPLYCCV